MTQQITIHIFLNIFFLFYLPWLCRYDHVFTENTIETNSRAAAADWWSLLVCRLQLLLMMELVPLAQFLVPLRPRWRSSGWSGGIFPWWWKPKDEAMRRDCHSSKKEVFLRPRRIKKKKKSGSTTVLIGFYTSRKHGRHPSHHRRHGGEHPSLPPPPH